MERKAHEFIVNVKQWLFNVEAALSVSNIKNYQPSLKPTMTKLDEYYSQAYNIYDINLDEVMDEFSRVKHVYTGYLNYSV